MMRDLGLNQDMTFTKVFLLERLKANRETHKAVYKEAVAGFHKAVGESLEAAMEGLKEQIARWEADEDVIPMMPRFNLSKPQQHLAEYDTVIDMLENTTTEAFELGPSTYRKLVMDEWEWQENFVKNAARFSMMGRDMAVAKGYEVG